MTNEQINKTIAEACGWKFIPEYYHGEDQPPELTTVTPDGRHLCGYYPNYLNDLNAMHEVEKQMKLSDFTSYREMLFDWLKSDCVCASASTKAEAFLRTIGKWEDEA